jgi:hypothetical protein
MFNTARHGQGAPRYLSTDHDPLFEAHQWKANLRILEINELKTVPRVAGSHPFVERPVPYLPEFLECRDGKVWPNDRPGLGVTVDERQLAFVEAITEEPPALRSGGSTDR